MLKFAVFLMTVPMWADVMTIYDTGNYFVGKASAQTAVSNSFNFDLAGLSGYRISGALLEARAGYGSQNYVLDPRPTNLLPGPHSTSS